MSDEKTANINETTNDWFLQFLVDRVNGTTVEIGITLQIGGLLVSGILVGGDKYFEGFGEDIAAAKSDDKESAETHRTAFAKLGERYKQHPEAEGTEQNRPLPLFIHLKNAKFYSPGEKPIPANGGVWWRGRISEVSAFILGVLETAE
jgi:hypothetical protein